MHQAAAYFFMLILSPVNWIILLLVAAYFFRKVSLKNICNGTALFIFILFGNGWLLDYYAKEWQTAPVTLAAGKYYSCAIVPGGFASPGNNDQAYFNSSADRFIQALKLYKQGAVKHILICGGNGKSDKMNFREGDWVKGQLIEMGIPEAAIFIEDRSNNTADNALYARQILDSAGLKPPYLLVTSAHHMRRATLLFKNAGVQTDPYPCNFVAGMGEFGFSSLLPSFSVLTTWDGYLKETAAYFWYKAKA